MTRVGPREVAHAARTRPAASLFNATAALLAAPLLVAPAALVLLAGCAGHPPPLPAAMPAQLPQAWLEPLRAAPCAGPLRASLRMEISQSGRPRLSIDGSLRAILPDTLRLSARFGPFKPLFGFLCTADSSEILLHQGARYWISPRGDVDWGEMNPASWAQALAWALCPADLLRELVPDGPGRMVGSLWRVDGVLPRDSLRVTAEIDPRVRSMRRIRVTQRGIERVAVRVGDERRVGDAWIPSVLDLELPGEEFQLHVELLGLKRVPRSEVQTDRLLRPPGWRRETGKVVWEMPASR